MDIWTFNLEIMGLSTVLVGVFALRTRLGRTPLYLCLGILLAFLSIGAKLRVTVPVPGGGEAYYTSLMHLSCILAGVVLVYALEGTARARRLIVSLAVALLVFLVLRWLLAWHLDVSDVDPQKYGRYRWQQLPLWPHLVSITAFIVDGFVIIIVYQGLVNLWRGVPQVVAFAVALVCAMASDGIVYGLLAGSFDPDRFGRHFLGKVMAGVSAAIPAAIYIQLQLRKHGEALRDGLIHRRTFAVLDLRNELLKTRAEMQQTRAEYAHVKSVFSRYVAPDVVEEILDDIDRLKLGGELREVTVMFADIRGYSTLSEHMGPEQIIDLLNHYFSAMTTIIQHHRGTIIEFEGDAILAVFGAPLRQVDHVDRAVQTSLDMLDGVKALNLLWDADGTATYWKDVGFDDFRVRIGLHTGPVVVGNLGSERRTKYAVIGDTVNIAARVEGLNKVLKSTILLTGETARQLSADIPLTDLGVHPIRGRGGQVQLLTPTVLMTPEIAATVAE